MNVWNQFVDLLNDGLTGLANALGFLGGHKWAAAIVLFTIGIQIVLLPLAVKQIRGMQAMQRLSPELKRLQQKYRQDKQRLMQETQALYQREGINPLAGCLPMIPQMPVLFAMFRVIDNLDHIRYMPFLGLGDLKDVAYKSVGGWVLIVIYTVTSVLATRQLSGAADPRQQRMQQVLPLVFVVFLIRFPTALLLYWTTQNAFRFIQQRIMLRNKTIPAPPEKGGQTKGSKPATTPAAAPVRRTKPPRRRR
jgi:YidC/Oxa1 family membrane protein insertase